MDVLLPEPDGPAMTKMCWNALSVLPVARPCRLASGVILGPSSKLLIDMAIPSAACQ
jgi:hypothetical protein